jgi:hypothetical protein
MFRTFTLVLIVISMYLGAQEVKESDLDRLLSLPGIVQTYYSEDCETKARYLRELVHDAVIYFQDKLQDTFDIKLLVLNRKDLKSLVGGPYILPQFSKNPDLKLPSYTSASFKYLPFKPFEKPNKISNCVKSEWR